MSSLRATHLRFTESMLGTSQLRAHQHQRRCGRTSPSGAVDTLHQFTEEELLAFPGDPLSKWYSGAWFVCDDVDFFHSGERLVLKIDEETHMVRYTVSRLSPVTPYWKFVSRRIRR